MKDAYYAVLERLVEDARRYRRSGFGTVDPEEATKHNLIEPLLESLGYGRDNIKKEFHILGDQVDYLLEQHTKPLLFMEAKSLLDSSPNLFNTHKQQVFRYIRNYRVSPEQTRMERPVTWIVLTNFREFHFIRVNEETPSFSFKVDELIARRDELWELLALENVEAHRIEELYDQTHKADLDKRFLADLKRWRLIIANGFALQNPGVSLPDLTKASQQLLDRFLFCRMLETDRLIEYNKLARQFMHYEAFYGERPTKPFCEALKESLFAEIKRDFNTELFLRPQLCDQLAIDNAYLSIVIGHEPMSPEVAAQCGLDQGQGELFPFKHLYGYDFSRMSGDIMGAVYERFLAHKLSAADRRVTIEETDELRKKEGIYYTPRYIVDYIIAHTVSEKIKPILGEAKALLAYMNFKGAHAKIRELQHVKVLDPAMGSGSFLLRAFDAFVAAYAEYNAECERLTRERGQNSGMLFEAPAEIPEAVDHIGMHVASENIFGVDLDDSAVEVAKLNIWMRLMIAEKDFIRETLRTRRNGAKALSLLPTLANNLKRGDSLIDDPAVAGDTAFDWHKQFPDIMARGGFDCVIGNPPYRMLQPHNTTNDLLNYLRGNYVAAEFKIDLFHLFLQRGVSLLNARGRFGYIIPTTLLNNVYAETLRRWIMDRCCIEQIAVAREMVFQDADVHTSILLLRAEADTQKRSANKVRVTTELGEPFRETESSYSQVSQESFRVVTGCVWNILITEKNAGLIARLMKDFEPLERVATLNRGLITGDRDKYFSETKKSSAYVPILEGADVQRYYSLQPSQFVLFERPETAGGCWDAEVHLAPHKIAVRQICQEPTASLIRSPIAVTGNLFTVRAKSLKDELYLLGIINSQLTGFFWRTMFADFKTSFPQVTIASLSQLPIKKLNPKSKKEIGLGQGIISCVERIANAHKGRQDSSIVLHCEVAHRQREACPLGFYLQPDYTTAVRGETLIDDVQREGFVHGIRVESNRNTIAIAADVSDDADSAPRGMPIARLTFADETLQRFIYAMWQRFLEENARKKKWTAGKKPKPVYDLIVHELTPLVFFQQTPGDNLREIRAVAKAVAAEAGTFDLAALETEITTTDVEIDDLVYKLYGLTAEERQVVEDASRR